MVPYKTKSLARGRDFSVDLNTPHRKTTSRWTMRAMLDFDFWKALGTQFRCIEHCDYVTARWITLPASDDVERWTMRVIYPLDYSFETLAERCGCTTSNCGKRITPAKPGL
jgi:hypothetical protein